jgi:F-type H+-transporting ATPase subunit epsilon
VNDGREVSVAAREAFLGEDLSALETLVRDTLRIAEADERRARAHAEQLRVQAIRQMIGYLRPQSSGAPRSP